MVAHTIGVRNKIARAKDHLSELQATIKRWGTSREENSPFVINHQPERKRMILRHGKVREDDGAWPLIVGDIAHNLRTALDHLVCQLAILNGNDTSCCSETYFPICICKPDFKKAVKVLEPLLSPDAFTYIEKLQPYQTANISGKEPIKNTLWIISKLDNIDKHRMLLVVGKYFRTTDITCRFNDGEPVKIEMENVWRPLEDGAEFGIIDLAKFSPGPDDKMRVEGGTEVQVFITETGSGIDGVEVGIAMLNCIRRVEEIVDVFENDFFTS